MLEICLSINEFYKKIKFKTFSFGFVKDLKLEITNKLFKIWKFLYLDIGINLVIFIWMNFLEDMKKDLK